MQLEVLKELNKDVDINLSKESKMFTKIVENVLDKTGDYILKAMPIQENLRDILIDVKKSLKSKDFSKILQTAVNSSIREGLEILGAPVNIIKDITKIKDVAIRGGLRQGICAAIDIATDKYLKNNLLGDVICKYTDDLKDFVNSKNLDIKIDKCVKKISEKQQEIDMLFSKWQEAYDRFSIKEINLALDNIKSKKRGIYLNSNMEKTYKLVENITSFVNAKKERLSDMQIEVCSLT